MGQEQQQQQQQQWCRMDWIKAVRTLARVIESVARDRYDNRSWRRR
jgi:hypothetical protein